MDTLATMARQRKVMATIADLIVAAGTGKALRVAVAFCEPGEAAFVDHLTRALHARGRRCHCLAPNPTPGTTDGSGPADGQACGPTVAVITSGGPGVDENEPCRINIQLDTSTQTTASVTAAHREAEGQGHRSLHQPDIIVDYLDPGGPTLRHIVPTLAEAAPPAAGSQPDRRGRA